MTMDNDKQAVLPAPGMEKKPVKSMVNKEKITIDGHDYILGRFKMGQELEYGKVVGKMFKDLGIKLTLFGAEKGGDPSKFLTFGKDVEIDNIVNMSSETSIKILSIALEITEDEVKEIEDTKTAEKALKIVTKYNPPFDVIKKLTALLTAS